MVSAGVRLLEGVSGKGCAWKALDGIVISWTMYSMGPENTGASMARLS